MEKIMWKTWKWCPDRLLQSLKWSKIMLLSFKECQKHDFRQKSFRKVEVQVFTSAWGIRVGRAWGKNVHFYFSERFSAEIVFLTSFEESLWKKLSEKRSPDSQPQYLMWSKILCGWKRSLCFVKTCTSRLEVSWG